MKNKIIACSLVFMFTLGYFQVATTKKVEAIATTMVAGYTISQILGAMALSATVVGAGYAVTDSLVQPDDNSDFTNFLQQVFKQTMDMHKYESPPPPKPLGTTEQATLLSMLAKQGIEVGTELYDKVYDYFNSGSAENNIPDPSAIEGSQGLYWGQNWTTSNGIWEQYINNNKTDVRFLDSPVRVGMVKEIIVGGTLVGYMKYTKEWRGGITSNYYMRTKFIKLDNSVAEFYSYYGPLFTPIGISNNLFTYKWNGTLHSPVDMTNLYEAPTVPDNVIAPETMVPSSELTEMPFKPVDLTPLNGLVSSDQELLDIVNGVKEVSPQKYRQISDAFNDIYDNQLQNPNFIGASAPVPPSIDPTTGTKVFGDPKLENPITTPPEAPDSEASFWEKVLYWLKSIWTALRDIPTNMGRIIEKFFMNFQDFFKIELINPWNDFRIWLQDLLENLKLGMISITEWLLSFPDMFKQLIVPLPGSIAETWEPLILLWHDTFDPVIEPFKTLNFYSVEYQDVYADLTVGGVSGNYKIIDYQYIKTVRDSVQSIIRSFFWILILFFNLDQAHRLIRNQGILGAYVKSIEPPQGGKK